MPRKAIDYQKVIIYKLVCNDLLITDLYVGHTTDFTNRKKHHKSCCLNSNDYRHNYKVYKIMRENGSWINWSMIEIEKYPCKDKNEARARERFWYEKLNATLNSYCPTLDIVKRKQSYKICNKNYCEKNKEKIQEQKKDYYDQNKDKFLEYQKDYREKNKDKIKDNFNEKHKCGCGGCFTTAHRSAHFKTKKHLKYIQENESE
jgi:hypothetical protein